MGSDEPPDAIAQLLEPLDADERRVLMLRFGLDRGEPRTLEEVGEQLGLTSADVRAVEERAMEKLNRLDSG